MRRYRSVTTHSDNCNLGGVGLAAAGLWRVIMLSLNSAVPGSFRKPVESTRFAQGLKTLGARNAIRAGIDAQRLALVRSRFAPMPQEPEDARLTGVTRSLDRRLLALNVRGSVVPIPEVKTA